MSLLRATRRLLRALLGALLVIGAAPQSARGQLPVIDKLFSSVTALTVSYTPGLGSAVTGSAFRQGSGELTGLQVEVLFDIGRFAKRTLPAKCLPVRTVRMVLDHMELRSREPPPSTSEKPAPQWRTVDTVKVLRPVERFDSSQSRGGVCAIPYRVTADLSFGFAVLTGFDGSTRPAGSAVTVRGSVQDFPMIGVNLTFQGVGCTCLKTYLGGRLGYSSLQNVRAFSGNNYYTGSSMSWMATGRGGVWLGTPNGRLGLFVEPALSYRQFRAIDWTARGTTVPLTTALEWSTFTVAVGAHVHIR